MIRSITRIAVLLAAGAAASALSAKAYVDYTPAKGVWDVNAINVDPNHLEEYLTNLKRTLVPGFELMKKRGMIDDYKFLVRNGYTKDNPSVITMLHFTSMAMLEPNRARDEAMEKELQAGLSEADSKAVVAGYEKYRSFIDDALYSEVTYPK